MKRRQGVGTSHSTFRHHGADIERRNRRFINTEHDIFVVDPATPEGQNTLLRNGKSSRPFELLSPDQQHMFTIPVYPALLFRAGPPDRLSGEVLNVCF